MSDRVAAANPSAAFPHLYINTGFERVRQKASSQAFVFIRKFLNASIIHPDISFIKSSLKEKPSANGEAYSFIYNRISTDSNRYNSLTLPSTCFSTHVFVPLNSIDLVLVLGLFFRVFFVTE